MQGLIAAALLVLFVWPASAAGFQPYPGAQPDAVAMQQVNAARASSGGGKVEIWTTGDAFDKVVAFYEQRGKEYTVQMPGATGVPYERLLPAAAPGQPAGSQGVKVKQAYFIFDGAPDLAHSKDWITVLYPSIDAMSMQNGKMTLEDIRDVTAIERITGP